MRNFHVFYRLFVCRREAMVSSGGASMDERLRETQKKVEELKASLSELRKELQEWEEPLKKRRAMNLRDALLSGIPLLTILFLGVKLLLMILD